jgi:hypothetical protein
MTEYDWMQAMSAFSFVYDDTGLFGIHFFHVEINLYLGLIILYLLELDVGFLLENLLNMPSD